MASNLDFFTHYFLINGESPKFTNSQRAFFEFIEKCEKEDKIPTLGKRKHGN